MTGHRTFSYTFRNVHGTSHEKQDWQHTHSAGTGCTSTGHYKGLKRIMLFHSNKWLSLQDTIQQNQQSFHCSLIEPKIIGFNLWSI